jgi:modification methylase
MPPTSSDDYSAVWITGRRGRHAQLALGQDRIPPALAAYAITHYTRPGAFVLDPDCRAGTVLVEALRAGRHAIGLTAHRVDAWPEGMVLDDTPMTQADGTDHLTGLTGRVDLLLTTPRHHAPSTARTGPLDPNPLDSLTRTLVRCRGLLHPDGRVVIILPPQRHHRQLLDLTRGIMAAGHTAGLLAFERYVAFLAEPHGTCVVTRVSLAQRRTAARRHHTEYPITRTAHHDVLVFQVPEGAEQVVTGLATTVAGLKAHLSWNNNTGRPLGGSSLNNTTHQHATPSPSLRKRAA